MRAAAFALAGLAFLGAVSAQGPTGPFVPIGVWYGGGITRPPVMAALSEQDPDRWREDLETIRALGFTTVTSWIGWGAAEPVRDRFRFEALDRMFALARGAGLRIVLQLYTDTPPSWIAERYPDAAVVKGDGSKGAGVCRDHPGVREERRRFIAAITARAARERALHAVGLAEEPRAPDAPGADQGDACFCPHTLRRFRAWLQQRYQSIDVLNRVWQTSHTDWSQIQGPPSASAASYAGAIDWRSFSAAKLQDDLELEASAASDRGPRALTGSVQLPFLLSDPTSRRALLDPWWAGARLDAVGAAMAPSPVSPGPWPASRVMAGLDAIRSATGERGWWLSALQAGQATAGTRVGAPVTPADIRLWSWAAVSRGARALGYSSWYPMSSGYDAHGYGLVDLDGSLTDRARAAGEFAGIISRNPALFAPLRPRPASVAILYDRTSLVALGELDPGGRSAAEASLAGIYRALFERNMAADFLHPDEVTAGRAAAYRAVFVPYPLLMSRQAADLLAAYVRGGGSLIADARPAWSDEHGRASRRVPGHGLDDIFGVREREVRAPERIEFIMEREIDGPLSGLAGRRVAGAEVAAHLQITGANVRVLARFEGQSGAPGSPAVVMSRHGNGRAVLMGSLPGAAYERDPAGARSSGDLVAAFAALAGATPDVRLSGGAAAVETRFLESAAATVLIAINHAATPQTVTMTFAADTPEAIWLNLETGASVNFVAGPDGPTYTYTFRPRDVLVLMIKKEWR